MASTDNKNDFDSICHVWFGLVSLFNGISTFVCYLMPKPFSKKNAGRIRGFIHFPRVFAQK